MTAPVLRVRNLVKHFPAGRAFFGTTEKVHAVDGVDFEISRGETLALVGESGCGKSTVGRLVMGLLPATAGEVEVNGVALGTLSREQLRRKRSDIQIVFQDPFSSLNPRMRVRDIIAEPIRNFGLARNSAELDAKIKGLLEHVRLPADAGDRWPHQFSGGQRQRIGIARALAPSPEMIVCDEAVSALDVSVKAQIVNLLRDLQAELGLAQLFISHDLAIVEHIAHRVAVMYLGQIVEIGDKKTIFSAPKHPYTQALLSAVPIPIPNALRRRIVLRGDVPSPINPPQGCRFHTRCPKAFDRCRQEKPNMRQLTSEHKAACHLLDDAPVERVPEVKADDLS